jgi:hypothetical protein
MPNHVTSRCKVTGPAEEIEKFRAQFFRTEGRIADSDALLFDFGAAIPRPTILDAVEAGTISECGASLILFIEGHEAAWDKLYPVWQTRVSLAAPNASRQEAAKAYLLAHPDWETQGRLRLQALKETGYGDWYQWSIDHWGTKWNSYNVSITSETPLEFRFDTAWSFPEPVFVKIAEAYPSLSFDCVCFDEGFNFAGVGAFNPTDGQTPFEIREATDELYEAVYGHPPDRVEDDAA